MAAVQAAQSQHATSLPSPTLTNPEMVLPDEIMAHLTSSPVAAGRQSSSTYLRDQKPGGDVTPKAQVKSKKSLGSMSQRLALQRATTAEDSPGLSGDSPASAPSNMEGPERGPEEQTPSPSHGESTLTPPSLPWMQRKLSFISTSTATLDWDAIPEYKHDGEDSEIETLDGRVSGNATPTRSTVGENAAGGAAVDFGHGRSTSRSSAELSKRAELILANAKKRLNLMDQNLKGARALTAENLSRAASLHAHKSPYTNRYFTEEDDTNSTDSPQPVRHGHLRNRSDNTIMNGPTRTRAAVGGEPLPEDEEESPDWKSSPLRTSKSQELPKTRTLRSMHFASRPQLRQSRTSSSPMSPDGQSSAGNSSGGSSPATTQLKQQVQNLNRRISMLKERTMEDSLRRQSFQNLRQPNPLTDAEHQKGSQARSSPMPASLSVKAPSQAQSRWSVDSSVKRQSVLPPPDSPTSAYSRSPTTDAIRLSKRHSKSRAKNTDWSPISPVKSATATIVTVPATIPPHASRFSADSEAPLPSPGINSILSEDSVSAVAEIPSPEGGAHEERKDAFDYHNFFLHSTLGRVSRMSESSSSASEASDDTARATPFDERANESFSDQRPRDRRLHDLRREDGGGMIGADYETPEKLQQIERGLHRRFSSLDSLSSSASATSFATATEGVRSRTASPVKRANGSDGADSGVGIQDRGAAGSRLKLPQTGGLKLSTGGKGATAFPRLGTAIPGQTGMSTTSPNKPLPQPGMPRSSHHVRQSSVDVARQVDMIDAPPAAVAVAALVGVQPKTMGMKDKAMIFMLMESTRKVVERLQGGDMVDGEARVLRRRLEEARKVLEGRAPVVSVEEE